MKTWHKTAAAVAAGVSITIGGWLATDALSTRKEALEALRDRKLQASPLAAEMHALSAQIAEISAEVVALRTDLRRARTAAAGLGKLATRVEALEGFAQEGDRFTAADAAAMEARLVKLLDELKKSK